MPQGKHAASQRKEPGKRRECSRGSAKCAEDAEDENQEEALNTKIAKEREG
jgi:hypothetical protein